MNEAHKTWHWLILNLVLQVKYKTSGDSVTYDAVVKVLLLILSFIENCGAIIFL